jgi:hypothetical protein
MTREFSGEYLTQIACRWGDRRLYLPEQLQACKISDPITPN